MRPPRYQNLPASVIPTVESTGSVVRVIAGVHAGTRGMAETMTPVNVVDVLLADGARFEREAPERALAYVIAGALDGHADGSVLYLERGRHALKATGKTRILWMEGERIGEPVAARPTRSLQMKLRASPAQRPRTMFDRPPPQQILLDLLPSS
jgi:redox-sensitive bicupin YhaK (pirin superfamily)